MKNNENGFYKIIDPNSELSKSISKLNQYCTNLKFEYKKIVQPLFDKKSEWCKSISLLNDCNSSLKKTFSNIIENIRANCPDIIYAVHLLNVYQESIGNNGHLFIKCVNAINKCDDEIVFRIISETETDGEILLHERYLFSQNNTEQDKENFYSMIESVFNNKTFDQKMFDLFVETIQNDDMKMNFLKSMFVVRKFQNFKLLFSYLYENINNPEDFIKFKNEFECVGTDEDKMAEYLMGLSHKQSEIELNRLTTDKIIKENNELTIDIDLKS